MKKLLYIFLAVAGLSLTSCNPEMLDTNPTDKVSGTSMLNTTDGGYQALNGTIRMLWQWGWTTSGNQHQCVGPQGYNLMADLMGEDMVMAAMGNGWFWYDYLYGVKSRYTQSSWRSYDVWNYYYTLISNVNYIINAKDTMEGTQADVNYIIGNAYAIRAYCYAYLGMTFARSYIGHEDMLCVPVYTENTVSGTPGKARETNRAVFGQALSDINNAVALLQGAANRDGIGKASVKVGHSVEFHRMASNRDGTGGHDQAVIVLRHHLPPIVLRQSCQRVCDHNLVLRRVVHQSGKIQRIFSFFAGQFTIDVLQSKQISGFQQASQTEVILRMNMLRKKTKIPASLPRQIGSQIARSTGYANAIIKRNPFVQKGIQNPSVIGALHPAAFHHQSDLFLRVRCQHLLMG